MKIAKFCTITINMIMAISILLPISPILASPNPVKIKSAVVNLTGTIRKLTIEGTCYQLATDDGKKYELMGKFPKIEGTRVQIRGVIATDTVTICQVGQPVQVRSVRVIK